MLNKKILAVAALALVSAFANATPINEATGLIQPATELIVGEITPSKPTELTEVNVVANTIKLTELTVEERRPMITELVSNKAHSKHTAVNMVYVKNAALPEKVGWQKVTAYKF
ncbi:hypothetical protein [Paraglaciecola sp.]|uniref:hypothetical protein n=1 Tax=Paraglaciecola sp. TaxID=1920173 RepID=UPI003EF56B3E